MWIFLEKHFEEVLTGVLVMFMASMVFFQVVMRYVFSLPTSWSDELAIYAMLWSVYISVAWAVRERAHIRVMNFAEMFQKNSLIGKKNTEQKPYKITKYSEAKGYLLGEHLDKIHHSNVSSFPHSPCD